MKRFEGILRTSDNRRNGVDETELIWTELSQLDNGLIVPLRTEGRPTLDGKVIERGAIETITFKVNEPLEPDALSFRFPEYALVEHRPAVNGRTKVELWGADDKPIKEIVDEVEDLKEFLHLAPRFAEGQSNSNRKWFWVLIAGVITVASVIWFRRRK